MLDHIGLNRGLIPIGEWVDLEAALLNFKTRQRSAGFGLECFAPSELSVERRERGLERNDFADFAAAVGIIRPAQPGCVFVRDDIGIGRDVAQVGEANAVNQRVAVRQRLRKMLARFEKDDGHIRINAADQVEQHRALGTKARNDGGVTKHMLLEQDGEHLNRITPTKHLVEADRIGLGVTRCCVDPVDGAQRSTSHDAVSTLARLHRPRADKHVHNGQARLQPLLHSKALRARNCQSRSGA